MSIEKESREQRIYIDLDSLLDTRLAVAASISGEGAVDIIDNPDYYSRELDNLGDMTNRFTDEQYQQAWKDRNADVLELAKPTAMLVSLKSMVQKLSMDAIRTPFVDGIIVDLNIYPYSELSKEEREEMRAAMSFHLGSDVRLNIVNHAPTELVPGSRLERYSTVIMYRLNEWVSAVYEKFDETNRVPRITFVGPAIYESKDKVPTPMDIVLEGNQSFSPWAAAEVLHSMTMTLCFQKAADFSILRLNDRVAGHKEEA